MEFELIFGGPVKDNAGNRVTIVGSPFLSRGRRFRTGIAGRMCPLKFQQLG